jgi:hypothetical protein
MSHGGFSFQDLVEKALNDSSFREALMDDPASALDDVGAGGNAALVSALEKVDWVAIERVAKAFGSGNRTDTPGLT